MNNILIGETSTNTSNIDFQGNPAQIGYFNSSNSNVGINEGIIISTGEIFEAIGPNDDDGQLNNCLSNGSDLIENTFDIISNDAGILSFDFIAEGDFLNFNFVFASEEYLEYVNAGFNDAFGFFISGPNPNGGNYNNYNIALLPNGDVVSIDNVNDVNNSDNYNNNGSGNCDNWFGNDPECNDNSVIQFDGFTNVLTASAQLICNEQYTINLIVADAGDCSYSSAIFLEAGSFDISENVVDASVDLENNTDVICGTTTYNINASATNSVNTIWETTGDGTFNNTNSLNVNYTPGQNDLLSGNVTLTITGNSNCGEINSDELFLTIINPVEVDAGTDSEICEGELFNLNGYVNNAIDYFWSTSGDGSFNNDDILNPIYTPGEDDLNSGNVDLYLTANGNEVCGQIIDNITLNITKLPIIEAGVDFDVCGLSTNLNGLSNNSTNVWSSNNAYITSPNNLNTDVSVENYGQHTFLLNSQENGCFAEPDEITVNFIEIPVVDLGQDIDICSGQEIQISSLVNGNGNISWSPVIGLNNPNIINPIINGITDSTLYTLTITNSFNNTHCISSDELWVNVIPTIEVNNQLIIQCEDEHNSNESEVNLIDIESEISNNTEAFTHWFSDINLVTEIANPNNYTVSGNQTIYAVLSANLNCDNTAIVEFNINSMPEANNFSINLCDLTEDDISLDLTNYESQITSDGNINWINQFGLEINSTNYQLIESQVLTAEITNDENCFNSADVTVNLNSSPNISIIESDEICQFSEFNLSTIVLDNNNNTNGIISFHSETPANINNQISNIVSPNISSTYYILSMTEEGCTDEKSFELIVHPKPNPFAGNDTTVCGLSINLNASIDIGGNNQWLLQENTFFSNSESETTNVTVENYGSYIFTWEETTLFGCYNNSTVNIDFIAPPSTNTVSNISICPGEEVVLQASAENYTNISWSSNGSGLFSNYNAENTLYIPSNTDIKQNGVNLIFTALNSPCPSSISYVDLNIYDSPTSNLTGRGDICDNIDSLATLILNTNNGVAPYTITINKNGENWLEYNTNNNSDTLFVQEEGYYTISTMNDNYCNGTFSGEVKVYKRPTPYAQFSINPSTVNIGESEVYFYNHSLLAEFFTWDFGDSTFNNIDYNPIHLYSDTGTFNITLKVMNEFGCTDSVSHKLKVNPNFDFYIPSAFTPNGDGQNDIFTGKGHGFSKFEMTIFNRWGELIFYTDKINDGWNGKANNLEVIQNGIYTYRVVVTDMSGKLHTYTGELSLVR